MIGALPKGPNDGAQLVTNKFARHLVDNGDVLEDNVEDADVLDPDEPEPAPPEDSKSFDKAVEKAVRAKLKELRAGDEKALKKQLEEGNKALDAEILRIREEGERSLSEALEQQKKQQDESFDDLVAEAVQAAQKDQSSS